MNETKINLTQDEINDRELNNPANWHLTFYFSREDSRIFVPRRIGYGQTVNFARKGTYLFLLGVMLMPATIIASIAAFHG
jgi:uncharacterized membrane protein